MNDVATNSPRIASLDQFRGYTVLGMFFVNFVGHFHVRPGGSRWPRSRFSSASRTCSFVIWSAIAYSFGYDGGVL